MANLQDDIKHFYDKTIFPGPYTAESIKNYQTTWNNDFIDFIMATVEENAQVLDVGCGSGLISNVISYHKTSTVTAVDWAKGIDHGKSVSNELGTNNITWVMDDFSLFDESLCYDVIVCQGALHHMPNWQSNLNKIKNLLKPNGILLLGVYHPVGKFFQKFVKAFFENATLKTDQTENPFELSWTLREVKRMCSPMTYEQRVPQWPNLDYVFNGGLTLYKFKNTV